MDLHRAKKQPEWATVAPSQQNYWQRTARRTNSVVTPGNILTIAGFLLSLVGLVFIIQESYWYGLGFLWLGRALDIADGMAASRTGTKSPLGESLDAGLDKLITVITIGAFFAINLAPWFVLAALLLPHLLIAIISYSLICNGKKPHPSVNGKISMALAWLGLLSFVLLKAAEIDSVIADSVVYLLIGVSILLSTKAALGYRAKKI